MDIVEVGPRDGLQNERRALSIDARVQLIRHLVECGARRIEAVSFVRADRVPQMAGAEEVLAQLPRRPDLSYIGLALNRRGAERAALAGCAEMNIVVPVTDAFSVRNQNTTVSGMITAAADCVRIAKEAGIQVTVTLAVAFGCPFSGPVPLAALESVYTRIAALGVDEIAFADTIGVGSPRQVLDMAEMTTRHGTKARLRFHFHNTRNTGYANAHRAARLVGLPSVALDASVGGFGGCPFAPKATGNIATEDLGYLLRQEDIPHTSVDLASLTTTAEWLAQQLGSPLRSLLPRAGDFPQAPRTSP
ncbi:hydroxymethylglutaryl-CoA lyase [Actinacidiphila sp. DG2A-62]|uniref:hydroxymethylglutaryl-CoA lyase n=1 Tax=Actinacidiphila sp. DG2A-62 TaxID=3108821 RepID=UPI002DBB2937|nr:hydroxymethylglutaryl-CoA lyase [Actinacidiphila sp. DG2A-62]MEC3997077.1 hydroxymethylglutaryl-CoA lyase [Actinacidiphila sp. DG2A-62]